MCTYACGVCAVALVTVDSFADDLAVDVSVVISIVRYCICAFGILEAQGSDVE